MNISSFINCCCFFISSSFSYSSLGRCKTRKCLPQSSHDHVKKRKAEKFHKIQKKSKRIILIERRRRRRKRRKRKGEELPEQLDCKMMEETFLPRLQEEEPLLWAESSLFRLKLAPLSSVHDPIIFY